MIENVEYVGPFKLLKFDLVSGPYNDRCSFEIPPARIVANKWVLASPQDYHQAEVGPLIEEAHKTVWTDEVVNLYKASREGELVASYNDRTLSDEQFNAILEAVPELSEVKLQSSS